MKSVFMTIHHLLLGTEKNTTRVLEIFMHGPDRPIIIQLFPILMPKDTDVLHRCIWKSKEVQNAMKQGCFQIILKVSTTLLACSVEQTLFCPMCRPPAFCFSSIRRVQQSFDGPHSALNPGLLS